jgi:hypothetical protein
MPLVAVHYVGVILMSLYLKLCCMYWTYVCLKPSMCCLTSQKYVFLSELFHLLYFFCVYSTNNIQNECEWK